VIRDEFAEFAVSLSYALLPAGVVREVKRLLIDHVASMLAGPRAFGDEMPPLPRMAQARGGSREATVVGVPGKYPCLEATLANTAMGFTGVDAWHKETTLHVPAILFCAGIAVAERERASGRDLLCALVAGAEVMIRASAALGSRHVYARGFHPTSICGPLGCAVAAGCLIGLDAPRMAEAISIAAVLAAGSSIWRGDRTPASFCVQLGRAAESGVLAAFLAAQGGYGVERIFEDPRGFLGCYSGEGDASRLTEGLGSIYHIERLMMQRFWFGPYLLTSIESLIAMMAESRLAPGDIAAIEARVPTTVMPLIGAVEYPRNRLATLTTLRYALAVVSHLGQDSLYSMRVSAPEWMSHGGVRALFERVTVSGDEELDRSFPGVEASILEIRTRDGRTLRRRHDGPVRGDPDNPLEDAEIERKFEVMAAPELEAGAGAPLLAAIRSLESVADVNDVSAYWAM
jgi:2-methylcitrate dehydratase PrpD